MNNNAPIQEPAGVRWSPSWASWFQQVFDALGWGRSFNYSAPIDFPSIPAQSQSAFVVSVPKVRAGSAVIVTPAIDTPGVYYSGVVTADNQVTVYAKNFSSAAVNPITQSFRIIVLQN